MATVVLFGNGALAAPGTGRTEADGAYVEPESNWSASVHPVALSRITESRSPVRATRLVRDEFIWVRVAPPTDAPAEPVDEEDCQRGTCTADCDDGTGTGTPDDGVGIEDLLCYLNIYDLGWICADTDDGSETGTRDGGVGIEDLLYFLGRYDAGC